MATPAWLPPLNSSHQHHITVEISQTREAQFMELVNRPMFLMDLTASVDFISDKKGSKENSFHGLEFTEYTHLPWHYVASEIYSQSFIGVMLYELCKFGLDGDIAWEERHLTEEVASCCELFEDIEVFDKIDEFLCDITEKEYNIGKNFLQFNLMIRKVVIIPDEELKSWNSWYNQKKRSDPYFEFQFKQAIRRPRTDEEFLEEIRVASRGTSESSISQGLEVVEVEQSIAGRTCSICLEEFLPRSQAIKLPCCHVFDQNCIRRWLQENQTCPLCRFTVEDVSSE